MVDVFWYYASTLVFVCVLGAFLCVYRYYLGNRLVKQTTALRAEINRLPKGSLEMLRNPSEKLPGMLGDIGVEGIMNELGIDPGILKNPLVKGLVEKYAPRVMEQLSKGGNGAKSEENQVL